MRLGTESPDVCSSDLRCAQPVCGGALGAEALVLAVEIELRLGVLAAQPQRFVEPQGIGSHRPAAALVDDFVGGDAEAAVAAFAGIEGAGEQDVVLQRLDRPERDRGPRSEEHTSELQSLMRN